MGTLVIKKTKETLITKTYLLLKSLSIVVRRDPVFHFFRIFLKLVSLNFIKKSLGKDNLMLVLKSTTDSFPNIFRHI